MTESDKYKIVTMLFVLALMLGLITNGKSQSIAIDNSGRYMVSLGEEEKAIKSSSSCIKSKEDLRWETHINNNTIIWEVKYIKDTKMYFLYKQGLKYYESSTITGIRSKYASDLLGREIKIQ